MSATYLGVVRVVLWFYMGLDSLAPDYVYEEPKEKPQSTWIKKENEGWLKARGVSIAGNAQELKAKVATLMGRDGGPPELAGPKGGSIDNVKACLKSLLDMVQVAMATEVDQSVCNLFKNRIRVF